MEGQISAKMILDSIDPRGNRLRTLEVIMPRYILAEFNTHRMLGKNSASSRAIPLRKMILSVINNTFIPYAWQEDHKGMQGTTYLDSTKLFCLEDFMDKAKEFILGVDKDESLDLYINILKDYKHKRLTLVDWWLLARDKVLECVAILGIFGVTKQLANRLLEPFMYHKVLVSGTEWDNFFNLRCPQYEGKFNTWKSWKDVLNEAQKDSFLPKKEYQELKEADILFKLQHNKGQADIHMMFLAEAIWDATNESTPVQLKEGEWHIPYGEYMDEEYLKKTPYIIPNCETNEEFYKKLQEAKCRISIARCARLSYQTLGDNPVIDYEKDLELYENLFISGHWSPFEHVAKVMTEEEYNLYTKGKLEELESLTDLTLINDSKSTGWCRNYKGFIQYRELID